MFKKSLVFGAMLVALSNSAMAACALNNPACDPTARPLQVVPLEDGGMLALAAGGLALGIRIAQRKRK